ncbi:hypothetical protein J2Z22_003092 [Paenibacillus forsythiae]|uniref:DUF4227 family protein n=1 Tax=Paenibacillus forsythiae TaxID=365616 RepID=A0ABU3H9N3_9BACL|nr:DUF4227 family protein [Paenibacillus forsythiae]MDT3427529.1 hypothetical protein [Paenibacillus forsythiae]
MIFSVPKALRRLGYIVIFVALSFLFYNIMDLLHSWINPVPDPDIPEGSAVRAFNEIQPGGEAMNPAERLRLYYWYGE